MDDFDTDNLERVTPGGRPTGSEYFAVRPSAEGAFSAAADRRHFDGADAVNVFADPENLVLAFEPADENTRETLALSRGDCRYGADVALKSALNSVGLRDLDLDESRYFDVAEKDGLALVDLSPLADDARTDGGAVASTSGSDVHPTRAAKAAASAETLATFAENLGLGDNVDRARTVAMDNGVYGDLQDNPGGAYRGGSR